MKVALAAALAFSLGLGISSVFWLHAGLLTKPDTVVTHEWVYPPRMPATGPPPFTPLTPAEEARLQEIIRTPCLQKKTPPPSMSPPCSGDSTPNNP